MIEELEEIQRMLTRVSIIDEYQRYKVINIQNQAGITSLSKFTTMFIEAMDEYLETLSFIFLMKTVDMCKHSTINEELLFEIFIRFNNIHTYYYFSPFVVQSDSLIKQRMNQMEEQIFN